MNETIYYNGNIITMEDNIEAEAILVKEGKIKKLGSNDEILSLKSDNTEIVNLDGKTLMPAFIDSHSHITNYAITLGIASLNKVINFDEILDKLNEFKNEHTFKEDEWIVGFGYDNNNLEEKSHPTKELLDKVSADIPILITHASGHIGVINSKALEILNINSSTPNPEGGLIGREANSNEPNGYLEETAFIKISKVIKKPTLEEMCDMHEKAQYEYLKFGITTAQEGLVGENEMGILQYMSSQNRLKLDVIGYVDLKNSKELLKKNKIYVNNYINNFKIGGYKIFLDGSPQGKTAWLKEAYENSDGYKGYPVYTDAEVKELIKTSLDDNLQLLTHCNGDAAANQLTSIFLELIKENNYKDTHRPVMIHAQIITNNEIDKMKEIGMIPSYFVAHTYYWGDTHIKNLGKKRANRISPVKTTIDKGIKFTLHQDSPVIKPNMLETIWCAVNRITKDGISIGEEERVSVYEALKGVTINAAYQYFEEDIKGSIKEGKQADLVIFDKNPLTIDPMQIKYIKVLQTIRKAEVLYTYEK